MIDLVIFGGGKIAEVVQQYIREDARYNLVAFTVDKAYRSSDVFCNLPIVDFETVAVNFSPSKYKMLVVLGYQELNALRTKKLMEAKEKGYQIISYIHPNAGLTDDCVYGENCVIMPNVFIQPRVKLGDNVFVFHGAMIGHHTSVGNNCWITGAANISGVVSIGDNCFFAVNSTVGHGITIGDNCFLGANTLVTKNLDSGKVLVVSSTKPFRLNSKDFLKLSSFSTL